MNKVVASFLGLVIFMTSCSSSKTKSDVLREFVEDSNGSLCFNFALGGLDYRISVMPDGKLMNSAADKELLFFHLNGSNTEWLFQLAETNFKIIADKEESQASIVFAENLGFAGKSQVVIGFLPYEKTPKSLRILILTDKGEELVQFHIDPERLEELKKLRVSA